VSGPFRSHWSTAGKHRWRYPTTLAAMELLRSGYFLDAERCRAWRVAQALTECRERNCTASERKAAENPDDRR
jgi:hypothetical protein